MAAARSASPSSPPFARAASKLLQRLIFHRSGANWPPRWARTQPLDPGAGLPVPLSQAQVVFEAVGVPGVIDDILLRARHGTRLVVAGVCMQPDTMHPFFAIAKEVNIQFTLAQTPDEFAESLRSLAEGEIDVSPLVTGEVGLDAVGQAFDDLADPERHCKILVTP